MKNFSEEILSSINSEIELSGFDENIGIEGAAHMIDFIKPLFEKLRDFVINYEFANEDEEIYFFKELKPLILSRLIYYNKIYVIESKCPTGSDEVRKEYMYNELDSLKYFFDRHLDFYQYYRTNSTYLDNHYFVRKKIDLRLCGDSSFLDKDPLFSTGFDYKIAKILSHEMLRIYLNKKIQLIDRETTISKDIKFHGKYKWTASKTAAIELLYAICSYGCINQGNISIKEAIHFFETNFNIDLGDYYRTYIAVRSRKKDRTPFLNSLIDQLSKRMNEDDEK